MGSLLGRCLSFGFPSVVITFVASGGRDRMACKKFKGSKLVSPGKGLRRYGAFGKGYILVPQRVCGGMNGLS